MSNSSWTTYPKVWNFGHPQVRNIFEDVVHVQEKVDGSQFSFGNIDGVLKIKSKGAIIDPLNPPTMFASAVATVNELAEKNLLRLNWTYRGEVLNHPKHNVLAYDRTPVRNIILFDISVGYEAFISLSELEEEALRLGLEVVPLLYVGKIDSTEQVRKFLDATSILGGQKVEGVVVKNYFRHGIDGKQLMAKYVSEAFKEVHTGEWRAANPTKSDIIAELASDLRTPARWMKAVQHLRDANLLTDSPKDIGPLLKEIVDDTKNEEAEKIKEALFKYAWKVIGRTITHGFPEWYKNYLLERQFDPIPQVHTVDYSGLEKEETNAL